MKKSLVIFSTIAMALLAVTVIRASAKASDTVEIKALEQRLVDGIKAKDIKQVMSCYLPGDQLFVFDVVPPRQYVGSAAYQKSWQNLLDMFKGPINAEVSDIEVTSDGRIAYSHSIQRIWGTTKEGKPIDVTLRYTDTYRKIHGRWLIVQEHISVPVDMATKEPDLSSKP
jgi:ketosteroid isomerase-like protein